MSIAVPEITAAGSTIISPLAMMYPCSSSGKHPIAIMYQSLNISNIRPAPLVFPPNGIPKGIPKGIPNGIPNGIPYDIPNGMPNGVPYDIMLSQMVFVDYIFIVPNLKMFLQVKLTETSKT